MNGDDLNDTNDDDIARLLRASGARAQMPDDLRAGWEAHFRSELAQVRRARLRRYLQTGTGIAAVLLVAVLGWFMRPPGTAPAAAAMVVRHVQGSAERADARGAPVALARHQRLAAGDVLRTGAGHIALSYGRFEVRMNRDTQLALAGDSLELLAGEIFVSGDSAASERGLVVRTARGSVRDIGTQFTVRLSQGELRAIVREGSIELTAAGSSYLVDAGAASARQIAVTPAGEIMLADAAARGADWDWIHRAGAAFDLDGASALAFLEWVARETGRELAFAGEAARIYANTTLLHGDIAGLAPAQALEPVLATTDLVVAQPAGATLTVSLQRPAR